MTDAYRLLDEAATAAEAGDLAALAEILDRVPTASTNDPQLVEYFLAGFRARLGAVGQTNLYLRHDEDLGQIDLFAVLNRHLPLLRAARYANDSLLPFLRGHSEATVLALGIGQGGQEIDLLSRAPWLQAMTVVGVDVAAESVEAAGNALRAAGAEAATDVDYRPVVAATEELNEALWESLRRAPHPMVVTASFALHHMRDAPDGQDARAVLFRRLRRLEPAGLALCEPDADHHQLPLRARFANAWHHYGTLFAAVDATPATAAEKEAMRRFVGQEIHNVIGASDEDRYERHEPSATWVERLTAGGFRLQPPTGTEPLGVPGFTAVARPTHLELAFAGIPLVAVMTAVPS
ncbi:GRAS family protein [Streptomyces sp. NPDC057910]|uniref:GRAS family protein n=1 Tax=Streptomyces sp. NPDC057910 TaxID=3346278 RepID=UPI0036EA6EF7